jgi:glycosyltransferase involved in cell wall biosynthesis
MAMDIVINPMVGGTGLKIKTVEALAYGRAVISTKAGASGLGIAHHDLLHEDIESLVGRVLAIVEHPEEAAAISAEMQASYMAYYQSVTANLAQLLRRIA